MSNEPRWDRHPGDALATQLASQPDRELAGRELVAPAHRTDAYEEVIYGR